MHSIKNNKTVTKDQIFVFTKIAKVKNFVWLTAWLTDCLTTVARLEAKRRSGWPPYFATITNLPVGCAFWGSDERPLSAPYYSFNLCHAGRLLLHVTKPYERVNFSDRHFTDPSVLSATKIILIFILWENYLRCPHMRAWTSWTLHDSSLDS